MKNLTNPYLLGILAIGSIGGFFVGKKYGIGWGIGAGIGIVALIAFTWFAIASRNNFSGSNTSGATLQKPD